VIVERWQKLTGKKAVLEGIGEDFELLRERRTSDAQAEAH
jgi:hypothetical protein